jgi:hypothetical protein
VTAVMESGMYDSIRLNKSGESPLFNSLMFRVFGLIQ